MIFQLMIKMKRKIMKRIPPGKKNLKDRKISQIILKNLRGISWKPNNIKGRQK